MQVLQDSIQPGRDSVISGSFILQSKREVDSASHSMPYSNLYQGHELNQKHETPQPLSNNRPDWLFLLFLFLIGVLAYLRVAYGKYLSLIGKAFLSNNVTTQIARDENMLVQRASIMLSVVFYLSASLLIYTTSVHYNWKIIGISTGFIRYLFIAVLIAIIYLIKFFILRISGWLFDINKETTVYLFNVSLINNMLGMALIPILAIDVFFGMGSINWLLTLAVILVAAAYIYRLIRGIIIGIGASPASPAYLFLYLCTLEIAPLFLLIKVVIQQ
jgi:hypothetical protein